MKKFREKPDRPTAEKYLEAGNFFWNSGMFVFKASVMKEQFQLLAPEIWKGMGAMMAKGRRRACSKTIRSLPSTSIDYAIMEKTDKAALLPSDFGWSDIGSWKSLYDFLPKDDHGNVIDGDVMAENASGCFIMGRERLIAANCIDNLVIVDTPDSVFVSDLDRSKDAKLFVEKLKKSNRSEHRNHNEQSHPWGSRETLEARGGTGIVPSERSFRRAHGFFRRFRFLSARCGRRGRRFASVRMVEASGWRRETPSIWTEKKKPFSKTPVRCSTGFLPCPVVERTLRHK